MTRSARLTHTSVSVCYFSQSLVVLDNSALFVNCNKSNPSRTCVTTLGTLSMNAFGSGGPPPSLDTVTLPSTVSSSTILSSRKHPISKRSTRVTKMILALKLRLDFLQYVSDSVLSRHLSLPNFWHLEAISCSFRGRISGSLFDSQVSDEFNFHRQRASCETPSVSRGTLKRSGVISCLCRSRSSFVSTPS